jgi:hypothetical protein
LSGRLEVAFWGRDVLVAFIRKSEKRATGRRDPSAESTLTLARLIHAEINQGWITEYIER